MLALWLWLWLCRVEAFWLGLPEAPPRVVASVVHPQWRDSSRDNPWKVHFWPDGKFWKEDPRPKHAKGRARQTIQYSGMWAGSGGGQFCRRCLAPWSPSSCYRRRLVHLQYSPVSLHLAHVSAVCFASRLCTAGFVLSAARGHDRITLQWDGWPAEHWVSADGGVNFVGEADKGQKEPQGRAGKEYSMYDFKAGAQLIVWS